MASSEASLNPEKINWQDSENHILLNPRMAEKELSSLSEVAREISKRRNLEGHVWISTSGSTSEFVEHNKLVALSKKAFTVSAESVNKHLRTSASDKWLQVLPRFHVGGLGIEVRAMLSQSHIVSDFEKWNPERIHRLIQDQKVTIASMVPTQVFDVVQAKLKAPKYLRAVIVGGGALTEPLYQQARTFGWPLLPSYGMTETCSQIATATLDSLQSELMPLAKRLEHAEWKLQADGILQVKAKSIFTCYGQRQKDGGILDWDPKTEEWFTSEDYADLKGDFIRVIGRKNDFIKIGGEGSSMGRLREIFDRIAHKLDATVSQHVLLIDAPSERLGTEIQVITTLQNKNEFFSQLKENFNREVLPFERIREVKYTANIPRSDLGKVLWAKLKKDLYGL
jgi:O-succinylbenzoic acid--CoA ligase